MTQIISKKVQMNLFDPTANSNKVWIGIAYTDGYFESRYGRVRDGANLASSKKYLVTESKALAELDRLVMEKTRKGYRPSQILGDEIKTTVSNVRPGDLGKLAVEQILGTGTCQTTADLIKYLAQVNIHNITHSTSIKYDASTATFRTPLGVLTPDAVRDARDILNRIEAENNAGHPLAKRIRENLVVDYYRLVPADFGMRVPHPSELLETDEKIVKQYSILDALEAAVVQVKPQTEGEKLFKCKLTLVGAETPEGRAKFREIRDLYNASLNRNHRTANLRLKRIYEVEIADMRENFGKMAQKLGNVRTNLWHGTKASNLLSILRSGLKIQKSGAHLSGTMFGAGIYTSLQSTKALNYATEMWNSSGARDQRKFMFLTEVAFGKMHTPKTRTGGFPKAGTNSTWVEAGTCGVMNHEAIVYNEQQINLRYLCEFGEA